MLPALQVKFKFNLKENSGVLVDLPNIKGLHPQLSIGGLFLWRGLNSLKNLALNSGRARGTSLPTVNLYAVCCQLFKGTLSSDLQANYRCCTRQCSLTDL